MESQHNNKPKYASENNLKMENLQLSEREIKELFSVMEKFLNSWEHKNTQQSDEDWLYCKMKEELPEKSDEELQQYCRDIQEGVREYEINRTELDDACKRGTAKEIWFQDKMSQAIVGSEAVAYGNYLQNITETLKQCNEDMLRVILTKSKEINMNPNLDGFIAEQYSVNTFNQQAALKNSFYRAKVLGPSKNGYVKNSVDITIRDIRKSGSNPVRRYQAKYGKDAVSTTKYLKRGNYHNQRILIAKEQKKDIQSRFSKYRSIDDHIESPDGIKSQSITKKQIKNMQKRVQSGGKSPKTTWNSYTNKELLVNLGKEVAIAGAISAAMAGGMSIVNDLIHGRKVERGKAIRKALNAGKDGGVKYAATAALKYEAEKGSILVLRKFTGTELAGVTCMGIENARILYKYAKGDISGKVALDGLGRTSISQFSGMYGALRLGAMIGSAVAPVVGTTIGSMVGGMIGYLAGSTIGNVIYEGSKKIGEVITSKIRSTVRSGVSFAKSVVKAGRNLVFGF